MPLALRHAHDPAPALAPLPSLVVRPATDASLLAALQGRPLGEMHARLADAHRAYVAWRDDEPAAWGWVATRRAGIGELRATLAVPDGERYLWNFVTRPAHRGLGIYPRLIDAIVRLESAHASRFWIAYAPENRASAAGIRRAGFATVAELSFDAAGRPALRRIVEEAGALATRVVSLPVVDAPLAPCWRCGRAPSAAHACCGGASCRCDYQRADVACAA